ncbi:MAG: general secretion pathway protein GspB [Pseudomonadota bacterium]
MSLILDALKKSDNERKTRIAPDMADVPSARSAARAPVWLWWFIGLLVINLGVLLVVLTRGDSETASAATTLAAAPNVDQPALLAPPPEKQPVEPLASATVPSRPVPTEAPPARTTPQPRPSVRETPPAAAPAPEVTYVQEPVIDELPLFDVLRGEGRLQLDDLDLSLHVYNAVASQRFVFINGRRYNEGEVLSEGPRVDAIRRDGVALSYRGTAFLLPRE